MFPARGKKKLFVLLTAETGAERNKVISHVPVNKLLQIASLDNKQK